MSRIFRFLVASALGAGKVQVTRSRSDCDAIGMANDQWHNGVDGSSGFLWSTPTFAAHHRSFLYSGSTGQLKALYCLRRLEVAIPLSSSASLKFAAPQLGDEL